MGRGHECGSRGQWQRAAAGVHGAFRTQPLVCAVRTSQWSPPFPRSLPPLHAVLGTGHREKATCCHRAPGPGRSEQMPQRWLSQAGCTRPGTGPGPHGGTAGRQPWNWDATPHTLPTVHVPQAHKEAPLCPPHVQGHPRPGSPALGLECAPGSGPPSQSPRRVS